ncbi:BRO-N domain-containing protein [Spartinivicinus poritis]|uniref:BRO family protein n=1 Tax=Spartinivicinus poritis TaxID=2994640 RepID=A0ABT5UJK9_9GAMM|nr:BRO family protein [Spartinivicinus sp. A2-2]MDE1465598.1 BRO family protein [Spartinivicinus sp. A2-2]
MTTLPTTLNFNTVKLSIVNHEDKPWLTSQQLAKALDYQDSKSVNRLYSRNSEEFSSDMTLVVNLTPSGKTQDPKFETRIFSPRGCHLIAMFACTNVAKEFRKWVLDVLENLIPNEPNQPQLNLENNFTNLLDRVRLLLVFEKGQLVSTKKIAEDELITSTEPKHLDEFIRACMPEYTLMKKENVLKWQG